MKKQLYAVLAILLVVSVMLSGCEKAEAATNGFGVFTEPNAASQTSSGVAKFEGEGFSSPEDAVRAYIDALREQDFAKAVSTFAIESFGQGYSLEKGLKSSLAYVFSSSYLPDMGKMSAQYNTAKRYFEACKTVTSNILTFLGKDALLDPILQRIDSGTPEEVEEAVNLFVSAFPDENDVEQCLSEIQFLRFTADTAVFTISDEYILKTAKERCGEYGCEDLKPTLAEISIGGTSYYIAFDTIKYGENWYLYGASLSAAQIGIPTQKCGAVAASDADF